PRQDHRVRALPRGEPQPVAERAARPPHAAPGPDRRVVRSLPAGEGLISMWQHRASGRPRVFGHRGAMGYAPENTFASFEGAVEIGVDAIELDVHLSADGEVVVIHDHILE